MRILHRFNLLVLLLVFAVGSGAALAEEAKKSKKESKSKKETVEVRQDRIKSVQKKPFIKKGRWELTPLFSISLNDAFYQKMGGGAAFSYHIADALGVELQAIYVGTVQTDMVGFFQQANQALPKVSRLQYYLTANLMWSPFYGKLSLFTDEIIHFDAYLVGGFGLAYTETGSKFATNIGIGLRYFATSWLVIKIEVRDIIYTEKLTLDVQRTEFSDVQNHVMLTAGISFFLPVDFKYEYQ
ncbi:MAG: outer membrane beta-barrel domain-containing protein [Deltaproteobacteria bacterium]|nr:outer membrane beta-barrel domain-containing protein [Deltaproteobacteria bacterium]